MGKRKGYKESAPLPQIEKVCQCCGKTFIDTSKNHTRLYCDKSCIKKVFWEKNGERVLAERKQRRIDARNREKNRTYEPVVIEYKQPSKNMRRISDINRMAKEQGLTYGEYVRLYG